MGHPKLKKYNHKTLNYNYLLFGVYESAKVRTYLCIRITDETRDPYYKYDGIRLGHTTFVPLDSIIQYPLDTTIIIIGNPFDSPSHGFNTLRWNLFYLDNPGILGPIRTIQQVQCPPHDTCDVEIRF